MWMTSKGRPQQREILIIKRIGWPILWISVSLFPRHPCHRWMGWWTEWPWWPKWRLYMGSAAWTSIHQGQPNYSQGWVPNLPATETNPEPLMSHHSPGWSFNYLGGDYIQPSHHGRDNLLFLPEYTLTLDTDLPFLHTMLLPIQSSVDLQNALSIIMVFYAALLLITANEVWKWALCSWNPPVLPYSPIPWGDWLDRIEEWPFEDSVIVPARW